MALALRAVSLAVTLQFAAAADPVIVNDVAGPNLDGAWNVLIDGSYAYVTAETGNRLSIVDISTPSSLVLTSSVQDATNLNKPRGLAKDGSTVYVASYGGHSLTAIDVSNPATPSVLGQVIDATNLNGAIYVQIVGTNAFVACHLGNALAVVDVSTPASPDYASASSTVVDATNLQGPVEFVISGNYAYVACLNGNGIAIVDVSNAASLSLTGFITGDTTNLGGAAGIAVSGTYAYVACFNGIVAVVDVSTPASPSVTGKLTDTTNINGAFSLRLSGSYAYVASYTSKSVAIVDVSTPASPTLTDSKIDATKLDGARSLALDASNNIFATASGYDGLVSLSWTSPAAAGNDPVARYGDRVRVFELPPNELVPLINMPDMSIHGSVFLGGPGEQWFNRMLLTAPDGRFMDIKMKNLTAFFNQSRSQRGLLQTLEVTSGHNLSDHVTHIRTTDTVIDPESMNGYMGVTRRVPRTASGQNTMIGNYHRECVDLAGYWSHFYICSTPASEYYGDFRHLAISYAHLDLLLVEIRDHGKLTGTLPELWGIVPMSETTKTYVIGDESSNISNISMETSTDLEESLCLSSNCTVE